MRFNVNIEKIRNDRQLLMLFGLTVAFIFFVFLLLQTRAESRPTVQGEAQLRAELEAAKADISAMSQKQSLESVESYWVALYDATSRAGIDLVNSKVPSDQRYQGPLQSRTGTIEGETAVVLSMLRHLAEHMPLFLYSLKIKGQVTEVTVSVVGV